MISIAIVNYPNCLKSALYGWEEMFAMANRVCLEQGLACQFEMHIIQSQNLATCPLENAVVLLPPSGEGDYYLRPDYELIAWLKLQHAAGGIIGSACAGAFILAATGLLEHKICTTHWGLAAMFWQCYPNIKLNTNSLLIHQGELITAGGMMSWLDLGLEIVAQLSQPSVMRQLGKILVVDTGPREQRFYQQFIPNIQHGDIAILALQQFLNRQYQQPVCITTLAQQACMSERTLLRRFIKATQYKPTHYLQRLRIQKACDLLETSAKSVEQISYDVGYQDVSAFRKRFGKVMGLSPTFC